MSRLDNSSQIYAASAQALTHRYGTTLALNSVSLDIPAGKMTVVIGPDGVGKSSLLALVAGARKIQQGRLQVLDADISNSRLRRQICPRIAYMPQGLGRNLYATLSVSENIAFFGRLFGLPEQEREHRIHTLTRATGLHKFLDRPAGKLSGGMRQKLGLCCALIHDPEILVLDEPTTGVDPLSRQQFWELVSRLKHAHSNMSVLVASAYMEEAQHFDHVVAMSEGRILATGTPADLLQRTAARNFEEAFVCLLPEIERASYRSIDVLPLSPGVRRETAIEAQGLTIRFGDFTAVDNVSFRIQKGEIFGFLGSNGCGKTTTMKALTGLLPASEGVARLFEKVVDTHDLATRQRVGYMSQSFSLYSELTVRQNLFLHARLFSVPAEQISARVNEVASRFSLLSNMDSLPGAMPLGHRQRLSLAVAVIHRPEILILDEPTSGVDPVARDDFWRLLIELSRRDGVTIFLSTHYMNEAQRCDRISLMHAGKVLVTGRPADLAEQRGLESVEETFIAWLKEAALDPMGMQDDDDQAFQEQRHSKTPVEAPNATNPSTARSSQASIYRGQFAGFELQRLLSFSWREWLELRRDPLRLTMALMGSVLLMVVIGFGISMDVEDLKFAVLDRDQSHLSNDYVLSLSGSRYFVEQPPIRNYDELDQRMRDGDIALAIEIPPGFARDVDRGRAVQLGVWLDGAMPMRAETVQGYVKGMHLNWLEQQARKAGQLDQTRAAASIEVRFRYNPDVKSLVAMVPAVIPLLLMLIPAMLATLSVVREKEFGSIINFYVTPASSLEFLAGKQLPYVALGMLSFVLLFCLAYFAFGIPFKGSFPALVLGAFLYIGAATALGLLISSFMRSQTAAVFGTAILTLLPAVSYSGLIDPVSSLQGVGRWIGEIYPTAHFLTIARGTFAKALGFSDLQASFWPLVIAVPVLLGAATLFLRKQEV